MVTGIAIPTAKFTAVLGKCFSIISSLSKLSSQNVHQSIHAQLMIM